MHGTKMLMYLMQGKYHYANNIGKKYYTNIMCKRGCFRGFKSSSRHDNLKVIISDVYFIVLGVEEFRET